MENTQKNAYKIVDGLDNAIDANAVLFLGSG